MSRAESGHLGGARGWAAKPGNGQLTVTGVIASSCRAGRVASRPFAGVAALARPSEHADFHRGEAEHPHPHDSVRRKFLELAAPVWGQGRAEALYDRVLDLERVPDVAALAGDKGL